MKTTPIHKIKQLFDTNEITESILDELRLDERKGVQNLIKIYERKQLKIKQLEINYIKMKQFEEQFLENKTDAIAGVDEAGRGPLAGPVVAASVILPANFKLLGLTDSKQLTENERIGFFHTIKEQAISYDISIQDNTVIDEVNIFEATKIAMTNCLLRLDPAPNIALIDAVKLSRLPFPTKAIIKGDEKSIAIAAASILAKVTRDKLMEELDKEYPMYDFKNNKGYGTKTHLHALKQYGPSPYHRTSFSPVMEALSSKEVF